jgi:hypothetical protein
MDTETTESHRLEEESQRDGFATIPLLGDLPQEDFTFWMIPSGEIVKTSQLLFMNLRGSA